MINCKDCFNMKVKIPLLKESDNLLTAKLVYSSSMAKCASGYLTNDADKDRVYDVGKATKKQREEGFISWQLKDGCTGFVSMDD